MARMPDEVATDLQEIGKPVVELLKPFMKKRAERLNWKSNCTLFWPACSLVTSVQDITSTGSADTDS